MQTLKGFIAILVLAGASAYAVTAQVNLVSLDGARVNVEGHTGKVVVLAIGASWLPLSGKQAEFTNALAKKYARKDVVVYFVATDSANPRSKNYASTEMLRRFSFTNKLNVPVLHDPDGTLTLKRFKVDQVPTFVILDKNGNVASEQFGGITTDATYDVTAPISKVVDRLL
ncbi:MAG TPA: TlpA disulfide reductase family protein [Pyrinomonadaceae bacterium]|nr:TlpA disulfide reductase family protein [Pyrinomonadaceae bacterium]